MITRVARGLWWYLRQASGESRWDEYVERCDRDATAPMSRRDFERHRADHREADARSRCC
jgi:uncharacterized short protein YbdD (DUF466 family)